MRRAILKLLLLTLLIYAVPAAYIQWAGMAFHNTEYPMWRWKAEVAEATQTPAPEILILGDSRTMAALIPNELSPSALSLAIGGATPITNQVMLSRYLKHNPAPRRVFVAFSPVHFEGAGYFWERPVKYGFFSVAESLSILSRGHEMAARPWGGGTFPNAMLRDTLRLAGYSLNLPWMYRLELANAALFGRLDANRQTYAEIATQRGQHLFGEAEKGTGLIEETKRTVFMPDKLIDAYFSGLLALCEANAIEVTLLVMPLSVQSAEALDPLYRQGFLDYLQTVKARHPSITLDAEWLAWPMNDFGDSNHLNARGALRYTHWVKKRHLTANAD